jgi:hypothetical protein
MCNITIYYRGLWSYKLKLARLVWHDKNNETSLFNYNIVLKIP